jgi:hypothetical protein
MSVHAIVVLIGLLTDTRTLSDYLPRDSTEPESKGDNKKGGGGV